MNPYNTNVKRERPEPVAEVFMGDSQLAARFARYLNVCSIPARTNGEKVIAETTPHKLMDLREEWERVIEGFQNSI